MFEGTKGVRIALADSRRSNVGVVLGSGYDG